MTRRVQVRRSPIHGNGIFAASDLAAETRLIEYKGLRLTNAQADKLYAGNAETGHTFLFTLNDRYVIDGNQGGNAARWINHSCA
ncbi:MAG: SET domain-containing protein-lysine N-methyltransferase, partial [Stagnimonas sp.]|nr:SET domain-containing protein-lysine N-methyltransferase [Stagnimonas sp.]